MIWEIYDFIILYKINLKIKNYFIFCHFEFKIVKSLYEESFIQSNYLKTNFFKQNFNGISIGILFFDYVIGHFIFKILF
jgi:hypothetical protein